MVLSVVRLVLLREEGRTDGDGDVTREEGAEDEGRDMGTGLLASL